MPFLYLRDPLFLFCLTTYVLNRVVLKAIWREGFVHEHLNDLICIPFWVPIMLFVQKKLGLRAGDASPRPRELVIPLIVWSWMFEVFLPQTSFLGGRFVADHVDVLFYALGALAAAIFWRWWYSAARASGRIGRSVTTHSPADTAAWESSCRTSSPP